MDTPEESASSLQLVVCPPEWVDQALSLLVSPLPPKERPAYIEALLNPLDVVGPPLEHLLIALDGERLLASALGRVMPGRVATVCPPQLAPGAKEAIAARLTALLIRRLSEAGVHVAQALLRDRAGVEARRLRAAGFRYLTDLVYMFDTYLQAPAATRKGPAVTSGGDWVDGVHGLTFEQYVEDNHERLARIIEATYEDSLDCPQLNGVRQIDDVLDGYLLTGIYLGELWSLVRHGDADVGCLLLCEHPTTDHVELIYMGLVPAARGRGWGRVLVERAQWQTRQRGYACLALAVDASNLPALRMYRRAGLVPWDERRVFLLVLER